MAQSQKTSNRRSSSSTRRSGTAKKSSSNGRASSSLRSSSSNGRSKTATPKAKRSTNRSSSPSRAKRTSSKSAPSKVTAAREAASSGTHAAGKAVTTAASKLKTPLMVGGAAIAGVAGGAALKAKTNSSRSGGLGKRMKSLSIPTPSLSLPNRKHLHLPKGGTVNLDKVRDTAQKVGTYGRQVDEMARAVERASEAAKKRK